MCLSTKYTGSKINDFKKTIGKDGITVYKVVGVGLDRYHPLCVRGTNGYLDGVNEAQTEQVLQTGWPPRRYQSGYHMYLEKKNADELIRAVIRVKKLGDLRDKVWQSQIKVIECVVKKSWIKAMGEDNAAGNSADTVVVSKAIFPKFEMDKNNED